MTKNIRVSAIVSCFNGGKYLPVFLQSCAEQTIKDQIEIVLVHNQPSADEQKIVNEFKARHPGLVNHIVVPREPLAVSTNRAIRVATGKYVCVWNVDDLRTEDSLELMAKTLDQHPEAGFTYGDYIVVNQWETKQGRLVTEPEFEKREFIHSMHLGPFYMWRKNLCYKISYWDEQCLQGADFEYAVRLAVETEGVKTQGFLGYYLDEGLGLSTKRASLQPIERTFVELRYGVYHKLDFWYYTKARKYNLEQVLQDGVWENLNELAPLRKQYMENEWQMLRALIRYPFWIIQRAANWYKRRYA